MRLVPKNEEKITTLFEELEFRTLLQRVLSTTPSKISSLKKIEVITKVSSGPQFDLFSQSSAPIVVAGENNNFELITGTKKLDKLISDIKKTGQVAFQIITDTKASTHGTWSFMCF